MSKAPALVDRVRSGCSSRDDSWLSRAVLHGHWLRYVFGMAALWLTTCDSLWTQFREANPINCLANPGICAERQVCNSQTRLCAVPELRLIAGGLGGSGNADDTGADARFNGPYGVATDGVGNLYVADRNNYTIRKIVLSTGVVSTIAGTAGMRGFDNGIGAAARFYRPSGLALDGVGNLYVTDSGNHTIRKVALSTGDVMTIAGMAGASGDNDGIGSAARFNRPFAVVTDGADSLYIADSENHTIRKVVASTGEVITIAGTAGMRGSVDNTGAAALFDGPLGVVADGPNTLYVTDFFGRTLRKVVVSMNKGTVTTIAGKAGVEGSNDGIGDAARFSNPLGVTADGAGNLFVVDVNNHTIRRVVVSTGAVTTIAGKAGNIGSDDGTGAAARFNTPLCAAADGAGNLFVADTSNLAIRKVALNTGVVTTIAGKAPINGSDDGAGTAARFNGPAGVAADGAGNLYVADFSNHTIRKVVLRTGTISTLAGTTGMGGFRDGIGTAAQFNEPTGVAADSWGNLYVADRGNHTIRKVVLKTGEVTTLAGKAGVNGAADDTGAAAMFYYPYGVATDGDGSLYVADTLNSTIRRVVVSTGVVTTIAGKAGMFASIDGTGAEARFYGPYGVATDGAGNLYVADTSNSTIRKVVLRTGVVTTVAGKAGVSGTADGIGAAARFHWPYGVALDGAGNLYVTDGHEHTLRKIQLSNAVVTTIAGVAGQSGVKLGTLPGRLNVPFGVAVLPTGEIFFADQGENAILGLR